MLISLIIDLMNNILHETAVCDALTTKWIGRRYHYFDAIGSTNSELKKAVFANNGDHLPDGTLYLTDFQSAGRGRLDRKWEAPKGTSILMSILFRPDWPVQQANWLTMIAGLGVAEAITAVSSLDVYLKWPNDLMLSISGKWHKIGGILIDGDLDENGRLRAVILGIGINVNIPADKLPVANTPASSLLVAADKPILRLPLLISILEKIEAYYETAVQGKSPQPAWNQRLINIGKPVQVSTGTDKISITGIVEGTDIWGQLLVRDEQNRVHTIAAGDVTLRT